MFLWLEYDLLKTSPGMLSTNVPVVTGYASVVLMSSVSTLVTVQIKEV